MSKPQRLPVGDSSFESIRANQCVYVDKTRHLFRMADEGKYYFMSRPRRFGKSLTELETYFPPHELVKKVLHSVGI